MGIKEIQVKVSYVVGLGQITTSKQVGEQLKKLFEKGTELDGMSHDEFNEAREWLNTEIKEADCFGLEYEIEELE